MHRQVWAEQLGEFYARVHGLSVVLGRIGWFVSRTNRCHGLLEPQRIPNDRGQVRNEDEAESMWKAEAGELDGLGAGSGFSVYLSHDDAGRFYQACVESEPVAGECITTFITSRQPTPRLDIEPARKLGFEPRDTFPEGLPFVSRPPSS